MFLLLAVPWIYFAICATGSAALPDVDYKALNPPAQVQLQDPDFKSENGFPIPAPKLQAEPTDKV